ncbi:MAG: hypothetical protein ACK5QX_07520, partial [bacterium]
LPVDHRRPLVRHRVERPGRGQSFIDRECAVQVPRILERPGFVAGPHARPRVQRRRRVVVGERPRLLRLPARRARHAVHSVTLRARVGGPDLPPERVPDGAPTAVVPPAFPRAQNAELCVIERAAPLHVHGLRVLLAAGDRAAAGDQNRPCDQNRRDIQHTPHCLLLAGFPALVVPPQRPTRPAADVALTPRRTVGVAFVSRPC